MKQNIKVTWKAFGDRAEAGRFISSVEIETAFPATVSHEEICEIVYADTNMRQGYTWNMLQPKLSETRTHTALSVGDEIEIDGARYICADFGFEPAEKIAL